MQAAALIALEHTPDMLLQDIMIIVMLVLLSGSVSNIIPTRASAGCERYSTLSITTYAWIARVVSMGQQWTCTPGCSLYNTCSTSITSGHMHQRHLLAPSPCHCCCSGQAEGGCEGQQG